MDMACKLRRPRTVSALLGVLLAFVFAATLPACADDEPQPVKRVGLKRLDVRDGEVNDLSGDATAESGDPAATEPDAAEGAPGDGDSVLAFTETVHPLLKQWCGGACHGTLPLPLLATDDPKTAHDVILNTQKVNFKDIAKSRIIMRIASENHNCPPEGCESSSKKLLEAVQNWASKLQAPVDAAAKALTTNKLFLSEASFNGFAAGLPAGTILFEAEAAAVKSPMAIVAAVGTSSGKVVQTPAGAGAQLDATAAAAAATLGTITYKINVRTAGAYELIGRVNGAAEANNSFYIRIDNGPLFVWEFPVNGAAYTFNKAAPVAAGGTPHKFTLAVGEHTVEIRQREEQAKVDTIVMTTDPAFNTGAIRIEEKPVRKLTFDIAEASGLAGAKLTIDVSNYSENAYLVKNPALVVPSGSLKVKGLKLLINGQFLPQHATYTTVDATVAAPGAVLSTAALVALIDKGADIDEFAFTFDQIEVAK